MKPHVGILDASRDGSRNFDFSLSDFRQVQRLILDHAGIRLADTKQDMVYSRIIRRLRATGIGSFRDYLSLIRTDPAEWQAFVNSLTTNLTSFFREEYHFPILAGMLRAHGGGEFRIWCSAASTGEEPYSLAITALETLGPQALSRVRIIATDIDTQVLAKAEAGVYSSERIERMDPRYRKYFLRGTGTRAGMVRVKPELQRMISFRQLNLLADDWPLDGRFDALFCRNVLIYFDKDTQRRVLERFIPYMTPEARLFIGHSESLLHLGELFSLRGKTVYELRRPGR
ncbi:CheR family methyltransferase [Amnimonas aquatica]|uniref:CheR family methyltransferase n=1 Tax=Amnimonas aquatica TaxID=2094561 RepID=UPI001F14EFBE|nr:CheR family methyltransferase [Amnimonas aquatica]